MASGVGQVLQHAPVAGVTCAAGAGTTSPTTGQRVRNGGDPVVVFVAAGGGHLAELHALAPRLVSPGERTVWVTEDTPQARSLLSGEHVVFTPAVKPRGYRNLAGNVPEAAHILRGDDVRRVVSTGAGIALAFLPMARALGIPAHFIESAARLDGPSLTGRLLAGVPGLHRYTQAAQWRSPSWQFRGTVFDGFTAGGRIDHDHEHGTATVAPRIRDLRSAVVTVGTMDGYPFDRLIRRLHAVLPATCEVTWQIGASTVLPLSQRGTAERMLPWHELRARISEADVVIAHAGVGSALEALAAGKMPVLVPRRVTHGEHVDDHQAQIAADLHTRGLALSVDADAVSIDHLLAAANLCTERLTTAAPFRLVGPTVVPALR